jgi:WD40 repeat protein
MASSRRRWNKSEKLLLFSPLLILLAWIVVAPPRWIMERLFGWPRVIKMPTGVILRGIALSADGKIVAAGGYHDEQKNGQSYVAKDSGDVYLYEARSGQLLLKIPTRQWQGKYGLRGFDAYGLTLSPDGTLLARCLIGDNLRLFDVNTGKQTAVLPFPSHRTIFSPDGKLLAAVNPATARIWNLAKGRIQRTIKGVHFYDSEFSPNGKLLACIKNVPYKVHGFTFRRNGPIQIWEVASGRLYREFLGESTIALSFSPDGSRIVSIEWGGSKHSPFYGRIRMCDVKSGRVLWAIEGQNTTNRYNGVSSNDIVFTPDGKMIVQHNHQGTLIWRDAANGQLLRQSKTPTTDYDSLFEPPALAFSSDGRTLVSRAGSEVHIWDIKP